ncbi:uncharacterized protein EI90DRAFT_3018387 [Cantharellus anzutake]|uniref:uncharacterized protein n=1 Tax=Cantharellus anzutake TaxID=1750568 RepID=UPI00190617B3|nr:uncharacterized protein EI90DRAFT_3018387 [Cantharellus anzutake]KAF8327013.1 hypothetical protein EI90DRAFT_3018387 [Cantharellus anzutake]
MPHKDKACQIHVYTREWRMRSMQMNPDRKGTDMHNTLHPHLWPSDWSQPEGNVFGPIQWLPLGPCWCLTRLTCSGAFQFHALLESSGMLPAIENRLLEHCQKENWLGMLDPSDLSYRSLASANGQSIWGTWTAANDRTQVFEVAFIGIITKAELSPYGNQHSAPFNSWREQGVMSTKFQLHVGMPRSAPASIKSKYADQLIALNRIKNVSGLGHHVQGAYYDPVGVVSINEFFTESVVEIHDDEYGWNYLDNEDVPYFHLQHTMFKENRAPVAKENKKISVVDAFNDGPSTARSSTLDMVESPSIFSKPEWDPDGHFRRAIPSTASQREVEFLIEVGAFDQDGAEIPRNMLELTFQEGLAVIGTATLHFSRARNTGRGEIRSFQCHWTAIQIVGQTNLLCSVDNSPVKAGAKRVAEDFLQSPNIKKGPFFSQKESGMEGMDTGEEKGKGKMANDWA